jgi:membrane protease YdiL (CAAX protease family)
MAGFSVHRIVRFPWLFWLYLLLIATAELVTAIFSAEVGMIMHMLLMVALLIHSALGTSGAQRNLALALTLAPLIRLLSLGLPLARFPQVAWYPLVAAPLFCATWVICRQIKLSRLEIGLRVGNLSIQLLLMGGGLLLGAIEYLILRPAPMLANASWEVVLISIVSLTIFTGLFEELIFRGLLQTVAQLALGRWALVYVALLFGVLHIGYLSTVDVIFVMAVGLLFGQIVRWCGSILGVTLSHGLTNITLFLLMPTAFNAPDSTLAAVMPWVVIAGAVSLVFAVRYSKREYKIAPEMYLY